MPDEGGKNGKGFDISKLKAGDDNFASKALENSKRFDEANPNLKAMRDSLDNGGLSAAAKAAQSMSAQLDPMREQIAKMATLATPARDMAERIKATGVHDRLGDISVLAGQGSHLAEALRGIERQRNLIDELSESTFEPTTPTFPEIPVIENPIVETNRKLDRIETQFSQISVIARDSAQVATDLQAYAAEFLQKFERAADDANQSGSKAIKVGWLALAIAIFVGAGQVFAPTLIRDQEAEALRQTVVDLRTEISGLRADQSAASERLIEALELSDQEGISAISELIEALEAQVNTTSATE